MYFYIVDDDKKIRCNIIKTFRDENNKHSYIIYTDGTKDKDGELEIYASRYTLLNDEYILEEIESDYEWNLIDNMLDSIEGN